MSTARKTDKKTTNNIYLSIFNGELREKVAEGTPKAVERINKNGVKVWEVPLTGIEGHISNISISDDTGFGRQLMITLKNVDETFVIQTSLKGGYATSFLSRVPNIKLQEKVTLRPYAITDKETDKTKYFLVAYQNDVKIESAFTKDEPNGLPELTKITKGADKGKWDNSDRLDFFENMIYGKGGINETLIAMYGKAKTETPGVIETELSEVDDLPFD